LNSIPGKYYNNFPEQLNITFFYNFNSDQADKMDDWEHYIFDKIGYLDSVTV
jgi:hypothetical protein